MFPYAPISNVVPWTQIIAGLNQSIYSTTWTANDASDVLVYSRAPNVPTSDLLQLVPTNQYTVQFIGSTNIVQVTFGNSFIPTQFNIITIVRAVPSQFINLYTNTNFTPSMLNTDFETLTEVDQQNQLYWQQIVPRYNISETLNVPIDTLLPVLGANQFWIKNASNTAFIPATLGTGGSFPVLGPFVLTSPDSHYPSAFNLGALGNGFLAQTTSLGSSTPYVIPFPVNVVQGGTGLIAATPFAVLLGGNSSTGALQQVVGLGGVGQVLTSSGAGFIPSWQSIPIPLLQVSQIASSPGVAIALSNTAQNLTSITLTPGSWLVYGNIMFSGYTTTIFCQCGLSTVTNSMPDVSLTAIVNGSGANSYGVSAPSQPITVSVTTTIYLVGLLSFTGVATMSGLLWAVEAF